MIYKLERDFNQYERWCCAVRNGFVFAINESREFFIVDSREVLQRFIASRNCFLVWGNDVLNFIRKSFGLTPATMNMSILVKKIGYELACCQCGVEQIHVQDNYKNDCALEAQNILYIYQNFLKQDVEMMFSISREYKTDFLNTSITELIEKLPNLEVAYNKPTLRFFYQPPKNLRFHNPVLKKILDDVLSCEFIVQDGKITHEKLPQTFTLNNIEITIGVGGLHGFSADINGRSEPNAELNDYDMTSYYPSLICYDPVLREILGERFVRMYNEVRQKRLAIKSSNPALAKALKLVLNSATGKMNYPYSKLYNPQAYVQITLTGQLYLLMIVDMCLQLDKPALSLNTDGITLVDNETGDAKTIFDYVTSISGLEFEKTVYTKYYGKDVNNYIAIKPHGIKGKGCYGYKREIAKASKNLAVNYLVCQMLTKGGSVDDYISDIPLADYCAIASCNGTQETIRFYHSKTSDNTLQFKNGRKVPTSICCAIASDFKPLRAIADDIDYEWYKELALSLLTTIKPLLERNYLRLFKNQRI